MGELIELSYRHFPPLIIEKLIKLTAFHRSSQTGRSEARLGSLLRTCGPVEIELKRSGNGVEYLALVRECMKCRRLEVYRVGVAGRLIPATAGDR